MTQTCSLASSELEKTLTPAKVLAKLSLMSDENRMVLAIKMSKLDMEKGDESTTLEDEQLALALKAVNERHSPSAWFGVHLEHSAGSRSRTKQKDRGTIIKTRRVH